MQYLCLVYVEKTKWRELHEGDLNCPILQLVNDATTVKMLRGIPCFIEEALAEEEHPLAGFCLIDARDLNDAIRIASKMPSASIGCLEVHPVKEFNCPF